MQVFENLRVLRSRIAELELNQKEPELKGEPKFQASGFVSTPVEPSFIITQIEREVQGILSTAIDFAKAAIDKPNY